MIVCGSGLGVRWSGCGSPLQRAHRRANSPLGSDDLVLCPVGFTVGQCPEPKNGSRQSELTLVAGWLAGVGSTAETQSVGRAGQGAVLEDAAVAGLDLVKGASSWGARSISNGTMAATRGRFLAALVRCLGLSNAGLSGSQPWLTTFGNYINFSLIEFSNTTRYDADRTRRTAIAWISTSTRSSRTRWPPVSHSMSGRSAR